MGKCYIIERRVRFILSEMSLQRISDGTRVRLRTPAAICLKLLLEKKGDIVTHNDLYHSCWEDFGMPASQNVLHNTIYSLRKALSETGYFESKIIQSINRRGFIFNRDFKVEVVDLINESDGAGNKKHNSDTSTFDNLHPKKEISAKESSKTLPACRTNLINNDYTDKMAVSHRHSYCQYEEYWQNTLYSSTNAKVKDVSVLTCKEGAVAELVKSRVVSIGNKLKKNGTVKFIAILITGMILISLFITITKEVLP
ncbi:transcriptional regulator [Pantoea sp. Ep11b]|uniref:winged helix-turn-helix domain-containing protein n=1 Tax=Pantoea sp. Ep11b TaxID=3141459 RepID=UPI00346045CF